MLEDAKYNRKKNVSNFFGALGYFACLIQWFWVVILYSSLLKSAVLLVSPDAGNVVTKPDVVINSGVNFPSIIFAVIVTIIVLVLTVYVLIKVPSAILKTSKKTVNEAAESVTPVVLKVQHKKDTKRNHLKLTARIVVIIKAVLLVLPIILTFVSQLLKVQIFGFYIAIFISIWLAAFTLIFFILQYVMAKALVVKNKDLW